MFKKLFRSVKKWFASAAVNVARKKAKEMLATNQPVKDAMHLVNVAMQSRFHTEADGKQAALQYARDLTAIAKLYADAYGDSKTPGSMSDEELATIDYEWGRIIDKYVPPDRLSSWVDAAFDYAHGLVDKAI